MTRATRFFSVAAMVMVSMLAPSIGVAVYAQEQAARSEGAAEQIDENTPTAPVEIDGNVLFRVRGVSSYPAEQRAEAIRGRIVSAASNARIPLADFRIMVFEGQVRIVAADTLIMAIVPADARMEQMSAESL